MTKVAHCHYIKSVFFSFNTSVDELKDTRDQSGQGFPVNLDMFQNSRNSSRRSHGALKKVFHAEKTKFFMFS